MPNDFDYQGKRPDQVAQSERTAGACILLLVLAALVGFLTACGRSPTEPTERAVYKSCGVRNVPATPSDPTIQRCAGRTP